MFLFYHGYFSVRNGDKIVTGIIVMMMPVYYVLQVYSRWSHLIWFFGCPQLLSCLRECCNIVADVRLQKCFVGRNVIFGKTYQYEFSQKKHSTRATTQVVLWPLYCVTGYVGVTGCYGCWWGVTIKLSWYLKCIKYRIKNKWPVPLMLGEVWSV